MTAMDNGPAQARVRALVQQLGKRESPFLRDMNGVIEFDVDGTGSWYMTIERGDTSLAEGSAPHPDCVISTDQDEFVKILRGDDNIVAAMLRGTVRVSGDLVLAAAFRRLLPVAS